MWAVTLWAVGMWFKWSLLIAAGVGIGWLTLRGSGGFLLVCLLAVSAELYLIRALHREWTYEAQSTWWWLP